MENSVWLLWNRALNEACRHMTSYGTSSTPEAWGLLQTDNFCSYFIDLNEIPRQDEKKLVRFQMENLDTGFPVATVAPDLRDNALGMLLLAINLIISIACLECRDIIQVCTCIFLKVHDYFCLFCKQAYNPLYPE